MSSVIILDDMNFEWDTKDINKALILWHEGAHIKSIAEFVGRSCEETFLLLMDQAKKGNIKERENYIWGTKDHGTKRESGRDSKPVSKRSRAPRSNKKS